jgi:hypothetical protein
MTTDMANKTDSCDIAEILLKVALNTITLTLSIDVLKKDMQSYTTIG